MEYLKLQLHKKHVQISLLFAVYFGIRLLSLMQYTTGITWIGQTLTLCLLGAFIWVSSQKKEIGFLILLGELLLGGSGQFLSLFGIILRTWLLISYLIIWRKEYIAILSQYKYKKNRLLTAYIIVGVVVLFAMIQGLIRGHVGMYVLQDTALYVFFILLFPWVRYKNNIERFGTQILKVFIVGTSVLSVLTYGLYSSGFGRIPDPYYHWFRNVVGGKITDLGLHVFRIVSSEHLFFVPIALILVAYILNQKQNKKMWIYLIPVLLILVINFTRMYALALVVGALVLLYKQSVEKWVRVMVLIATITLVLFSGSIFIASRGQSFGGVFLTGKAAVMTGNNEDVSLATRKYILPKAIQKIQERPLLGHGLGTPITFYNPAIDKEVTRTQFDWGYLEMIAELGIIGFAVYMWFIFNIARLLYQKGYMQTYRPAKQKIMARGALAGLIALCVINITTPALFQGFGVIYITFAATLCLPRSKGLVL